MLLRRTGLAENDIHLRETLFHTANGYLGLRACFEEGVPDGIRSVRGTYINGFYATQPIFTRNGCTDSPKTSRAWSI